MFEVCQQCFKRDRGVLKCPACGAERPPWAPWMRYVWSGIGVAALAWAALLAVKFGWKGAMVAFVLVGAGMSSIGMARRETQWGKRAATWGFWLSMATMALVMLVTLLMRK
jgi:hypothetical protein